LAFTPEVNPIDYAPIGTRNADTAQKFGLSTATVIESAKLERWKQGHIAYRGARRLFFAGLTIWGASMLAAQPQLIVSGYNFLRTSIKNFFCYKVASLRYKFCLRRCVHECWHMVIVS
jgi:hypothetical protein